MSLCENEGIHGIHENSELDVLLVLAGALFVTGAIDEVEPAPPRVFCALVLRFREAATAQSRRAAFLCNLELNSLHEVLCIPTPCPCLELLCTARNLRLE